MHHLDLLILSGILFVGFLCQWIAWRVRLPSILFLLAAGIVAGPVLGWLDPDALFGDLLEPMVSLAVAVILYEGSITLKLAEIRGHGNVVRNLVTVGVLITWAAATFAARYFLGWDIQLASLFGAIVTVSGPTVMLPLLRTIRPSRELSNIFRWEGVLVDPIGAILAVLVFNFIVVTQAAESTTQLVGTFALIAAVGVTLGAAGGQLVGIVLKRHWLPDYLRNYATLASVLIVFTLAELVASESGLLAVTIMGVWQANMKDLDLEDILDFKESLTLVLVAGLFIVLAARIDLDSVWELGAGAIAVLLFLQFVAGPLRAIVSSTGSDLTWSRRAFLGWLFPRGIVAAAVSALFSIRLEHLGFEGASDLVPMVFAVIVGTVIVQSVTGSTIARWLGVADPEPTGVLIVGTNKIALTIARALKDAGRRVVVASGNWQGISKARMAELKVFYGSPVSEYAERHLDLIGVGHLLALSERPGLNELACVKFRYEFGRENVYTMPRHVEKAHEKHQISGETSGRVLYDGHYSIDDLVKLCGEGHKTRTTDITENFTFDAYRAQNPDALILFYTDARGALKFPVHPDDLDLPAGCTVTSLVPGG